MLEQLLSSLMHHDWKVTTRLDSLTSFVLTGILLVSSYTDCEMGLAFALFSGNVRVFFSLKLPQ